MNKAIGLALLVAGILLIAYGINASSSISSSVTRAVSGTPTNKTLWLLAGGGAAAIAGLVLVLKPSSKI